MTVLLTQDFEGLATGGQSMVDIGYTVTNISNVKVSTTKAYAGSKSLECKNNGVDSVSMPYSASVDTISISFRIWCPDVTPSFNSSYPFLNIDQSNYKLYIVSSSGSKLQAKNGATVVAGSAVAFPRDDAWHLFEMTLNGDTNTIIVNIDSVEHLNFSNNPTVPTYIKFACIRNSDGGLTYYDNIEVTEPTASSTGTLNVTLDDVTIVSAGTLGVGTGTGSTPPEIVAGKWLNNASAGWDVNIWWDGTGADRKGGFVHHMHVDPATKKLYVVSAFDALGGIMKIDIESWTVEAQWNNTTTPQLHDVLFSQNVQQRTKLHSEGKWVVARAAATGGNHNFISVLNGDTNEIREFSFDTWETYGIFGNVAWSPSAADPYLRDVWIDSESGFMYCLITYYDSLEIGYLNLNVPENIYNRLVYDTNTGTALEQNEFHFAGDFLIIPETSTAIVSIAHDNTGNPNPALGAVGRLKSYFLETGDVLLDFGHSYGTANTPLAAFPILGMKHIAYHDGIIYGTISYIGGYGQDNYRGMIRIAGGEFTVLTPSWATVNDCKLNEIFTGSDDMLYIASDYGVTIYDPSNNTWSLYDNNNVENLTISGKEYVTRIREGIFNCYENHRTKDAFYAYSEPPDTDDDPCTFKMSTEYFLDSPDNLTTAWETSHSIRLNWIDNSTVETGFEIYHSLDSAEWELIATVNENIETYLAEVETVYVINYYKVRAINECENSAYTNISFPPPPEAPSNLDTDCETYKSIRLDWQDNSDNEVGFEIYHSLNTVDWELIDTVGENITTYVAEVEPNHILNHFKVRAFNYSGYSTYTNVSFSYPCEVPEEIPYIPGLEDYFFVDSGLTYNGDYVTIVKGLDHIEGEVVSILADGIVLPQQVVKEGQIVLETPAKRIHAGLPYKSILQTMEPEIPDAEGTAKGRMKRINRCVFRLYNTNRFLYGSTPEGELKEATFGEVEQKILFNGDEEKSFPTGWGREGFVTIVQVHPVPITVVAIIPEMGVS